jgi:hypothetical protein
VTVAHFSTLSKIVIDVPAGAHDGELAFWQGALGIDLAHYQRFPEYHGADLPGGGVGFLVQHLGDGSPKVHLDIHTSDRTAEVARLTAIGATLLSDGEQWTIMRDPAGLVFCVIPDPSVDASNGHEWP